MRALGHGRGEAVRQFLREFSVLSPEDTARAAYGHLRIEQERRGGKIGARDMLIAGHAMALGATLVINSEKEFRPGKGLRIENWLA